MEPLTIGVLALQGGFAKHLEAIREAGALGRAVRTAEELSSCNGLIIPGGESTSIAANLSADRLFDPLLAFAARRPLFGTCAGLILMAREVTGEARFSPLSIIDLTVLRNGFGRQFDSFIAPIALSGELFGGCTIAAPFIRAPKVVRVGEGVEILGSSRGEPVLFQQGCHLAATFHPELAAPGPLHRYFLALVEKAIQGARRVTCHPSPTLA